MASELHQRSQHLGQAAAHAATIASRSGPATISAMQSLHAASRACARAAQLLDQAAHQGQAFVARTAPGASPRMTSELSTSELGKSSHESNTGSLTSELEKIYSTQSFPVPRGDGRFFLEESDRFRAVSSTMPATQDGSYLAMIHGSSESVGIGNKSLSPAQLATLIHRDPAYISGQTVTLFSCETGRSQSGFAQKLAEELRATVIAPTELAWLPPEPDGSILITPMDNVTGQPLVDKSNRGLGRWRIFSP